MSDQYADPREAKIPIRLLRLLKRATQVIGARASARLPAFEFNLSGLLCIGTSVAIHPTARDRTGGS